MRIKEKAFGLDHINIASIVYNLGLTYETQGKCDEAIAQYQRALQIYGKAFGVDYIDTVSMIMKIGTLYKEGGRFDLAKVWLVRGHDIFQRNLGKNHSSVQIVAEELLECTLFSVD